MWPRVEAVNGRVRASFPMLTLIAISQRPAALKRTSLAGSVMICLAFGLSLASPSTNHMKLCVQQCPHVRSPYW
jgi:hypothetical protein